MFSIAGIALPLLATLTVDANLAAASKSFAGSNLYYAPSLYRSPTQVSNDLYRLAVSSGNDNLNFRRGLDDAGMGLKVLRVR